MSGSPPALACAGTGVGSPGAFEREARPTPHSSDVVAAAQLFNFLLHLSTSVFLGKLAGYQAPGLPTEGGTPTETIGRLGLWLIPVSTTLGGLLVGLLTDYFAPEAEGHGTDAVVKAFHRSGGSTRGRSDMPRPRSRRRRLARRPARPAQSCAVSSSARR